MASLRITAHIKVIEEEHATHFACPHCDYISHTTKRRNYTGYGREMMRVLWHVEEAHTDLYSSPSEPDLDWFVCRDGEPISEALADENACCRWLLHHQPMSPDWALRFEGYSYKKVTGSGS